MQQHDDGIARVGSESRDDVLGITPRFAMGSEMRMARCRARSAVLSATCGT